MSTGQMAIKLPLIRRPLQLVMEVGNAMLVTSHQRNTKMLVGP